MEAEIGDFQHWGEIADIPDPVHDDIFISTEQFENEFKMAPSPSPSPSLSPPALTNMKVIPKEEIVACSRPRIKSWATTPKTKEVKVETINKRKIGEEVKEAKKAKTAVDSTNYMLFKEGEVFRMKMDGVCLNSSRMVDQHKEKHIVFQIFDNDDRNVGKYMCARCILSFLRENCKTQNAAFTILHEKFIPSLLVEAADNFMGYENKNVYSYYYLVDRQAEIFKTRMYIAYFIDSVIIKGFVHYMLNFK